MNLQIGQQSRLVDTLAVAAAVLASVALIQLVTGSAPVTLAYAGGLAVLGLCAFFAPWVRETAPEIRDLSGFDLARRLGWMWAPAVAFFVMIPLALTRRSVHAMR